MTAIHGIEQDWELVDLVAGARAGDRDAMSELFRRFERHVLAIAFKRLGDWDEAQDLCQDAFFQAFRKLDQLQIDGAFAGWLQQIVVRMAINRVSRRKKMASIDHEILENTLASEGEAFEDAVRSDVQQHVRLGLEKLKSLDRETLVAFYVDGQSLSEMSRQFKAPVGTIKRRLHTARKRLARECDFLVSA